MAEPRLPRRRVLATVLADRADTLIVAGLGSPAWDLFALGDRAENFYLWGGMGLAAMTGLGLAMAAPARRVVVITGDGEMLMGLGSLATIAVQRPPNLAIIVLDNQHYGETGMQTSHTAAGTDLTAIARGAGIPVVLTVADEASLGELRVAVRDASGPVFAHVAVAVEDFRPAYPPRDGAYLKHRFRAALLGEAAAVDQ
ncbi:MAG: thiamine pyrophosphate-dependent enzyme [Alphaproteobacteria bacterium]